MGNQQGVNLPYDVADTPVQSNSTFELRNGWSKSDKKPVSVFTYPPNSQTSENALRRFKTIKHPNLLQFLDGQSSVGGVSIVTERVRPLSQVLEEVKKSEFVMSWGLYQIVKSVQWLHEKNYIHGNITIDAIYVNKQGDWKLGAFDLLTEYSQLTQGSGHVITACQNIPAHYLPPELTNINPSNFKTLPVYSIDTWMTGCLLFDLFSNNFKNRDQLKKVEIIPQSLRDQYITMITANPARRGSVQSLLQKSPYFQNSFVDACLFLEEINIKDGHEKERFFLKLPKLIESFPPDYCKFKILPHLVQALDFGSAGSIVLDPLLMIAKTLNDEEYNSEVAPSVIKWFKSPDKQVRQNLLENIETYVQHLAPVLVNEHIYPSIAQGFSDASPQFRTLTLDSVTHLFPKLNSASINNHLLKWLAKLQTDPEPNIKTSTTLAIIKLSHFMSQDVREKVLISAFHRALREAHYPPARLAGIQGFVDCIKYFSIRDTATRVIPFLSYMTVDGDSDVRAKAVSALLLYVKKIQDGQAELQNVTQNKSASGIMSQTPLANGTAGAVVGLTGEMLGWAFNSLSSKIIGGAYPASNTPSNAISSMEPTKPQTPTNLSPQIKPNKSENIPVDDNDNNIKIKPTNKWEEFDYSGWKDDENLDELLEESRFQAEESWDKPPTKNEVNKPNQPKKTNTKQKVSHQFTPMEGWDDDDGFDEIEQKRQEPIAKRNEDWNTNNRRNDDWNANNIRTEDWNTINNKKTEDWGTNNRRNDDWNASSKRTEEKNNKPFDERGSHTVKPAIQTKQIAVDGWESSPVTTQKNTGSLNLRGKSSQPENGHQKKKKSEWDDWD